MSKACSLCKGACCESIVLPIRFDDPEDQRWLEYHGKAHQYGIRMECRCEKLKNGKCSIYATRPQTCRDFVVGSPGCLESVKRRRPYRGDEILKLIREEVPDAS